MRKNKKILQISVLLAAGTPGSATSSVVVVGGLTPAAGLYYGLYNLRPDSTTTAAIAYAVAAGVMLHVAARDTLAMLRV